MNLQDMGSIGELVAAVATLGTLVYLAVQIRQSSEAIKASAAQAVLTSLNEVLLSAAASDRQARVMSLGQSNFGELSEAEQQQFMFWIYAWFRILEQTHKNFLKGHIDEIDWVGHADHLALVMKSASVRIWWAGRQRLYSATFRDFVNSLDADDRFITLEELTASIRENRSLP